MFVAQRRFWYLITSFVCLFLTAWLELFIQTEHLVGGGLNRVFLFILINFHVVIISALLYLIVRHSVKLFLERQKEVPGSVFKRNLLFAFILFSVIPSFFVFFTAGKFVTKSIDRWFKARLGEGFVSALELHKHSTHEIRSALKAYGNSVAAEVVDLQLSDDAQIAHKDGFTVYFLPRKKKTLPYALNTEALIWRAYRTFNDRTILSLKKRFLGRINGEADEQMFDFYGSLYWVKRLKHAFVVVVYRYPPEIRSHLIVIESAWSDYEQLQVVRNSIYTSYFFNLMLLTVLILFLSIWCAFYLAKGISKPIQELLNATQKVREGQWSARVEVNPSDDLRMLAYAFNEMTNAVCRSQEKLERNNKEMLAVLENISSAVFVASGMGRIIFCNAVAQRLVTRYLGVHDVRNKKVFILGEVVKNIFFHALREFRASSKEHLMREVTFAFDSEPRTFVIYGRVLSVSETPDAEKKGLLVVVDDVTDMIKMNKLKVWQEAAKQMAHEIKNPLTPIQLATQRLERKFGAVINDPIFTDCTTTILNHVTIIKDLVTHFALFAAMPPLHLERVSLYALVHEVLRLYQISYPEITFEYTDNGAPEVITTDCDKIKRVFINLLDNSVRALQSDLYISQNKKISMSASTDHEKQRFLIEFSDNGPGIPKNVKETLFLPYVSSEKKNMGLGLAIVRESVIHLGGSITLVPSLHGVTFHIELPL